MAKQRLIITIDVDEDQYELDTPDGGIDFEYLGQVIADLMLRLFDPENPVEPNENGIINLNEPATPSKPDMLNKPRTKKDIN